MTPERIGIGITCHNRNSTALRTITAWRRYMPQGALLVVVDDASTVPIRGATYRFEANAGIAIAKNKCLELLEGCTHVFLSDDDCYPIVKNWYQPYINSGYKHLSLTFDKLVNGRPNGNTLQEVLPDGHRVFINACGCMLYLHRDVIDKVGGFDEGFCKWGFEHLDLSRRIFNAKLTPYPFMDIPNWRPYFRSLDFEIRIRSSVSNSSYYRALNKKRYDRMKKSKRFIPYIKTPKADD